jgi:hypothetical protein
MLDSSVAAKGATFFSVRNRILQRKGRTSSKAILQLLKEMLFRNCNSSIPQLQFLGSAICSTVRNFKSVT